MEFKLVDAAGFVGHFYDSYRYRQLSFLPDPQEDPTRSALRYLLL